MLLYILKKKKKQLLQATLRLKSLNDASISLFRPPTAEQVSPKNAGADNDYLVLVYFWLLPLFWNNLRRLLGQSILVTMENSI